MGDKSKLKLGVYQNPRGDRSKESIKRYTDGFRKKNTRTTITDRGTVRKINLLTGGQAKIAAKAPPPNKIDEKDFAVLRAEKAKGRGMGLQDEKVKPGKVMKARVGKSIKTGRISDMSFDEKMKRVESGQINKKTGKFTSMNAMRDAKGFQKGESAADFNKRRMKIMEAAKIAKSTRLGKILLPVVGAAVAAKTYLNSKMKKDKNKKTLKDFREQKKPGVPSEKTKTINKALNKLNKKMGGGMMQKPIGYNIGGYKSKEDRKKAEKNIKEARSKEGLRSFLSERKNPMRRERYMEGRKARHQAFKKKLGRTALGIASSLNPVTSIARGIGKVMGKGSKKRDFQKGDYGDISVKKMGGGMMKKYSSGGESSYTKGYEGRKTGKGVRESLKDKVTPMKKERLLEGLKASGKMGGGMIAPSQRPGYSKGTMVKARGCKLGRTRPTKIT